ncbi:hypothetical protein [Spirosoma aerophilum]
MRSLRITSILSYGSLFLGGLLAACQPQSTLAPSAQSPQVVQTPQPDFKPLAPTLSLPVTIDYHDDGGTLASLVYRSTLTYDGRNRLQSISDERLGSSGSSSPWVQFTYTDNRLTRIDLTSISVNADAPVADEEKQPARFELAYSGNDVAVRLLIGGKEVQQSSLTIDEQGLPVRNSLTRLIFDPKGNLDWVAHSRQNPVKGTEIIEQRYDDQRTVFSQVREMQLLEGILSTVNRRIYSSGLVGLGSSLTTNNLIYTKRKNCDPAYGCREIDEVMIKKSLVNDQGFLTESINSLGAMGYYQFSIRYKQVNG